MSPGERKIGDLRVGTSRHDVTLGGEPVEVTAKEFALLRTLASDPTRVFTKAELLRDVWGFRSVRSTRTLDTCAVRLHRKLAGSRARFIVNVWGVGYRLTDAKDAEVVA